MMNSPCKPTLQSAERRGLATPFLPRLRSAATTFIGHGEPRLNDLLGDPIFSRLLSSDGVEMDELKSLIETTRSRLATQ
ncbi:MAG TPA: hypothetical protein VK558_01615 [Patescibacteria group bacterium]|nr:hypothetical protein [Patescibacteria group bacterium]